ncbi:MULTISPECIES: GNAT family N-acetyltransferase [unclassified Isoptericola]|uniref:GNAT family N-acetyltransferase n=1 Tax=unclassified Isoptericola TaxID=2623355 RepID=UPI003668219A
MSFAAYEPDGGGERVPLTVRPAVESDVEAMAAVGLRASRAVRPDAYRRAVGDQDRCVLVATIAPDLAPDLARDLGLDVEPGPGGGAVVGWGQTSLRTAVTDPAPAGHYLGGVTVDPRLRRRGVATALTQARIDWVAVRAPEVFFVVNSRNLASIALHRPWHFVEVARGPRLAGVTFEGGLGLLLRAPLARPDGAPPPEGAPAAT